MAKKENTKLQKINEKRRVKTFNAQEIILRHNMKRYKRSKEKSKIKKKILKSDVDLHLK